MNRLSRLLLFLTMLLVSTNVALATGIKADSFTISGLFGGYSFDGKQHLETMPVLGLRGGYNFTKYVGVEALFDWVPTESTRSHGQDETNVYRFGADAIFHLLPDNRLVPYLAAGYGGLTIHPDRGDMFTRGVFDYGPGIKYFLTDDLALRGDFRHLVFKNNDETLSNYEYTIGLTYQFGGSQPAPVAVAPPPEPAPAAQPEPPLEPPTAKEPTPGLYKYCITLNIEFDIDKDLVRPAYHDEVAKVGEFMKQYPTTTAVIEGHTDNVGTVEHNMDLSKRRAESVVNYLVDKFGIDRSRLSAKGFGPNRPVADNATDAGRQQNRRIEAIIDCAFDVKEVKPPEQLCVALLVEFDTGKADIKPQFRDEIAKVGDYMKKYPTTTAIIEGHTDNVGGFDYNMKLSLQRAENVVTYLVDNFGIDRSRLSAKGYGFTRRVAYNNTPEGRQKNRRINAIIDCVIKK